MYQPWSSSTRCQAREPAREHHLTSVTFIQSLLCGSREHQRWWNAIVSITCRPLSFCGWATLLLLCLKYVKNKVSFHPFCLVRMMQPPNITLIQIQERQVKFSKDTLSRKPLTPTLFTLGNSYVLPLHRRGQKEAEPSKIKHKENSV